MKTKRRMFSLLVAVLALSLASVGVFAKQENTNNKEAVKKMVATKEEKVKEMKNFQLPVGEQTNAQVYKEKIEKVTGNLKKISAEVIILDGMSQTDEVQKQTGPKVEEVAGEIAEEVVVVAEEVNGSVDETAKAIEKVESQNKFKKFLVGTDYKNLGQLRSSLVQNRNQIRKLTQLAGKTEGESQIQIETQLTSLMQERERIQTVIKENEGGFSILGWVFRLFNGYSSDEEALEKEEAQLEEEVAEVITDEVPTDETSQVSGETSAETVVPAESIEMPLVN